MKQYVVAAFVAICLSMNAFPQSAPIEGSIEYQKGEKRAAIIELPFTPEVIEGALKQSLERIGVKEERLKGMQVFKGARLTPTDGEIADLYFKVDKKKRGDENSSTVYLIVGRPNENVALRMPDDAYRMQDAKAFLSDLKPKVESYELELNIAHEEENIKKTEQKLKDIQSDQKNLEKRIQDLQDKLEQSKRDQDATNAEVNRLRSVRDALLSKKVASK
jgi:hypothetical protein